MRHALALRASRDAVAFHEGRVLDENAEFLDRYRRDPFALLDDEMVMIPVMGGFTEGPLIPYDHQREIVSAWVDIEHLARTGELLFRNVHDEKSRQMGVTWIVAYVVLWCLYFHAVPGLALSKKSTDVEDGAEGFDSFFGKVRYMHRRMPLSVKQPLQFRQSPESVIQRPGSDASYLVGEGATPDPGRGSRFGYVVLDEAAFMPWSKAVHRTVSRSCPEGRFYNSTANGLDNIHYQLRTDRPDGYTFLRHHWSKHELYGDGKHVAGSDPEGCQLCAGNLQGVPWDPRETLAHRYPGRLTSPWYDQAVLDMDDEDVASELDIDYERSLPARVYAEFSEEVHVADEPVPYDPLIFVELGWDYGLDMTAVVICQETPTEYRVIGEFEQSDLTPDQVAAGVRWQLQKLGMEEWQMKPEHTLQLYCVGDPAGEGRDLATGRPFVDEYRRAGFGITSQRFPIARTISATKRLMRGQPKRLVVSPTCERFIEHAKMNKWPTDRLGNRKPAEREPLNNVHNHMMRAFAYLISKKFPIEDEREAAPPLDWDDRRGLADPGIGYKMGL